MANRGAQIGETYLFEGVGGPQGTLGTVTSATVNEKEKLAYIAITRTQGGSVILTQKMTDEAAVEILHSAIQSGELQTPAGPVPATNKRVELNAAHFYRLNADGLIAESRGHFDNASYQRQLKYGPGESQQ